MITDVRILEADIILDLEKEILKYTTKGYELQGGICVVHFVNECVNKLQYFQTMIKQIT